MVGQAYEYLDAQDAKLAAAKEELAADYDRIRAEAERDLAEFWDARQFPTKGYLLSGIRIDRRLIELDVPSADKVGSVISDGERERAKRMWEDATNDVFAALREAFAELVGHLADRLSPNPDGTKRRLHETALDKVTEFIDLFSKRNVLDDAELAGMVEKARRLVEGKTVDVLRENELFRERMANNLAEVKMDLDKLVEDAPARRIRFED
jgi:hypothetical protein